jgi:hypothetical protein
MKKIVYGTAFVSSLFLFALTTGAVQSQGKQQKQDVCDRACLDGFVDQYLAALTAHDPSRLPATPNAKFTENNVVLKLGDGLWQTATGLGTFKLTNVEPESSQIGAIVVVKENGDDALMALRLKIEGRRIREIETLVARQGEGQTLNFDLLKQPLPVLLENVPSDDRLSLKELVLIVDKYFDAIEQSNGSIVAFADDAFRIENGIRTCNDPSNAPGAGASGMTGLRSIKCADQLSTRIFSYIKSIEPRRYVVVDRERGLVLGIFRFNHPGNIISVEVAGRGTVDMRKNAWAKNPTSAAIAELFKVQDRKIQRVMAVIVKVPYRMPSGWE